MAKVWSSRTSARPSCILQRVIGNVSLWVNRPDVLGLYMIHDPRDNTTRESWYEGHYNLSHVILFL